MDSFPASSPSRLSDQFRSSGGKRVRLHVLEQALLVVVAAHLVFLPWALGGMRLPAQVASAVLAGVGFILSLWPRAYTAEESGSAAFKLLTWPKLLRFPIFWLGALLLGYIVVQALNPAWRYMDNGKVFWMERVAATAWLPSGVEVPFERWGPWRMLLIYASAWLTVCSLWIGFTRRRTLQVLVAVMAVNGVLLSAFGVAQRLLGNGKIYGVFEFPAAAPFASFVYKNHAGEYLLLVLGVVCGLAGWYYFRGLRRMEKSNPSGVLAFVALCIAVSIVISYARGATLTMLAYLCVCIVGFILHQLMLPKDHRRPAVLVVLVLVFGYFLYTGLDALKAGEAWNRMKSGLTRQDLSWESREWAGRATREMIRDHWVTGAGAGSFRFVFPVYQHRDPRLIQWPHGGRMYWEQAHNDLLQFPAELGAVGCGLILIGLGWWLVQLVRVYVWENPFSLALAGALLFLLAYSWFDFPFQNPAILITWCVSWPVALLWARFEEQRSRG